ncbi:MAG: hypothetical protein H6Q97_310 [Nitrospirae bacterium]|nr:hypothetical protein [Nitrospirota bacterium]
MLPVGRQNIRNRDLRTSRSSAEASRAGNRQGILLRKAINFIVFQAAWFAAVLGAAHGMPWLGVVAVPMALALHLALSPTWRPELLLALATAGTGFVFDSILVASGSFSPIPYVFPAPFSSLWMAMLWVNLATTMNVSMGWLSGRYALAAVFGAIGGPVAYYSGAKLGAMTRLPDAGGLVGIGIAWAIALPLLYRAAASINARYGGPGKA